MNSTTNAEILLCVLVFSDMKMIEEKENKSNKINKKILDSWDVN